MTSELQQSLHAGVNLGGWLSQYGIFDHQHFQGFITQKDIKQIAGWGMDHVRLPFDYPVIEEDEHPFVYLKKGFAYLDHCIEWCQASGLKVILDLHHAAGYSFTTLDSNSLFQDGIMQERFLALWRTLAEHYKDDHSTVLFELLNEMVLPDSSPWNQLAERAIECIHQVDPDRIIILGGNHYNAGDQLQYLKVYDDRRILYTFHCYEPMVVTHQKAHWVPSLVEFNKTIHYPGSCPGLQEFLEKQPQYKTQLGHYVGRIFNQQYLRQAVQPVIDFIEHTRKYVYCGEFGVIEHAPMQTRINWTRDFIDVLRQLRIGRGHWSYKQMDFGLVDADSKVINSELVKIVSES